MFKKGEIQHVHALLCKLHLDITNQNKIIYFSVSDFLQLKYYIIYQMAELYRESSN